MEAAQERPGGGGGLIDCGVGGIVDLETEAEGRVGHVSRCVFMCLREKERPMSTGRSFDRAPLLRRVCTKYVFLMCPLFVLMIFYFILFYLLFLFLHFTVW